MDAMISGRTGLALVVDGGQLASIHSEEPERTVPRDPAELHFLLGEAKDFIPVEDASREEIVRQLALAQDREDALQLVLVAQDPELQDDIRREAVEELEELLQQEDVGSYLENVLYAHPLPEGMDLAGALRLARGAGAREVQVLLELFWTHQDAIREVREAWEAIPYLEFRDEQEQWQFVAVREGVFRELARLRAADRSVDEYFDRIGTNPAIRALPNRLRVLQIWLGPLLRARSAAAAVAEVREPEVEYGKRKKPYVPSAADSDLDPSDS